MSKLIDKYDKMYNMEMVSVIHTAFEDIPRVVAMVWVNSKNSITEKLDKAFMLTNSIYGRKLMRIFLTVLLTSLIMSFNVNANPLDDLSWVKPQIMSVINNKHTEWTPSDFAVARGDNISSISKVQIAKDVITKSGINLPNILNTILIWSK